MTDELDEVNVNIAYSTSPDRMKIDVRTRVWPLPADLPSNDQFHFDDITIFVRPRLPLAVVSYSMNGEKQELGLRIDIDKRVFLDHFDNPELEALASDAAPRIVHYLAGFGSSLWIAQEQAAGAFAD